MLDIVKIPVQESMEHFFISQENDPGPSIQVEHSLSKNACVSAETEQDDVDAGGKNWDKSCGDSTEGNPQTPNTCSGPSGALSDVVGTKSCMVQDSDYQINEGILGSKLKCPKLSDASVDNTVSTEIPKISKEEAENNRSTDDPSDLKPDSLLDDHVAISLTPSYSQIKSESSKDGDQCGAEVTQISKRRSSSSSQLLHMEVADADEFVSRRCKRHDVKRKDSARKHSSRVSSYIFDEQENPYRRHRRGSSSDNDEWENHYRRCHRSLGSKSQTSPSNRQPLSSAELVYERDHSRASYRKSKQKLVGYACNEYLPFSGMNESSLGYHDRGFDHNLAQHSHVSDACWKGYLSCRDNIHHYFRRELDNGFCPETTIGLIREREPAVHLREFMPEDANPRGHHREKEYSLGYHDGRFDHNLVQDSHVKDSHWKGHLSCRDNIHHFVSRELEQGFCRERRVGLTREREAFDHLREFMPKDANPRGHHESKFSFANLSSSMEREKGHWWRTSDDLPFQKSRRSKLLFDSRYKDDVIDKYESYDVLDGMKRDYSDIEHRSYLLDSKLEARTAGSGSPYHRSPSMDFNSSWYMRDDMAYCYSPMLHKYSSAGYCSSRKRGNSKEE